jgi:hypothetical protein
MGASCWNYCVPYRVDTAEALEVLRQEVVAQKKYYRQNRDEPAPTTIEAALSASPESGTHSVIDIVYGVATAPGVGKVVPLRERQLLALFDTTRPLRSEVEGVVNKLYDVCDRWDGVIVTAFEDDEPRWLFFVGSSGN